MVYLGLQFQRVHDGKVDGDIGMVAGTEAESSHLEPKSKKQRDPAALGKGLQLSKPASCDIYLSTQHHLLICPPNSATNWGMSGAMGDISHLNRHSVAHSYSPARPSPSPLCP